MWQPLGDPNVRCVAEGNAPRPMMVDGVVVLGHEERIKGWRMLGPFVGSHCHGHVLLLQVAVR